MRLEIGVFERPDGSQVLVQRYDDEKGDPVYEVSERQKMYETWGVPLIEKSMEREP